MGRDGSVNVRCLVFQNRCFMLFIECFKGVNWSGNEREGPLLGYFDNEVEVPLHFQQELYWGLHCSKFMILQLIVKLL